jgi:hypothetical protein
MMATVLLDSLPHANGSPIHSRTTPGSLGLSSANSPAHIESRTCYRGDTPSNNLGFDYSMVPSQTGGRQLIQDIRVKHEEAGCRAHGKVEEQSRTDAETCGKITLCGKELKICIDTRQNRATRTIAGGQKACFDMTQDQRCLDDGMSTTFWRIDRKVQC